MNTNQLPAIPEVIYYNPNSMDIRVSVQSEPVRCFEICERNFAVATLMCKSIAYAGAKRNHGLHRRIYLKGRYNQLMGL